MLWFVASLLPNIDHSDLRMSRSPPSPIYTLRGAGAPVNTLHFSCHDVDSPLLFSGLVIYFNILKKRKKKAIFNAFYVKSTEELCSTEIVCVIHNNQPVEITHCVAQGRVRSTSGTWTSGGLKRSWKDIRVTLSSGSAHYRLPVHSSGEESSFVLKSLFWLFEFW